MKRRLILLILIASSLFSAIHYYLPLPPPAAASATAANNEILINEVELNPAGTDSGAEKVELYNPSNSAVDLNGWTISSTAGRTSAIIVIGEGTTTTTTIPPGGYLIVSDGDSQQWLDNTGGEVIELRNDSGILIDNVGPFSDIANDDATWQRSPDGEEQEEERNWVFSSGTLGGANFGTFVLDPEIPSPTVPPEYPIIPPQQQEEEEESSSLPAATTTNSSVEIAVTPPAVQPSQNLTIVFIDVGQGDSILVILPNTRTLLIDGGEREGYGKVLATLQEHGLSHIDVVVATHPYADHIGGLVDLIKSVDVGEVLDSGQVHTTQTFEDFLDAIDTKQILLRSVRQGDSINLDPTVKIDVLNPPFNLLDSSDNEADFNDNSVVLKLTYGEFSALLTGDMEERNEARLVSENTTALDADVLKAGHHGSRTSSSLPFLDAVTPEVVVISLGAGNTYGHPHQEALDRISAAGVERLFRTDIDGTITLTVNGSNSEYYSILTEDNVRIIVATAVSDNDYYDISGLRWRAAAASNISSGVNLIVAYIQGY
ncbi:MAG TPA: lamin tail domain-containing protein [Nitrososphaera sp.]|nr:lamin tail domain-containing protein [Nitrososphaera sp.]